MDVYLHKQLKQQMCISVKKAMFTHTMGYIGTTNNNTSIMAYQMEAKNLDVGMNAMILTIPTKKIIKVHDTRTYNRFLTEMAIQSQDYDFDKNGLKEKPKLRMIGKSLNNKGIIHCKIGIYDVYTFEKPEEIKNISKYFENPPKISNELVDFYLTHYPDFKFIVVAFDNKEKMESQPFLIEFEGYVEHPQYGKLLMFPAVDNGDENGIHNGIPKVDSLIREDHKIFFPSNKGLKVEFSQPVPDFISRQVGFYEKKDTTLNGDFAVFLDGREITKIPLSFYSGKQLVDLGYKTKEVYEKVF